MVVLHVQPVTRFPALAWLLFPPTRRQRWVRLWRCLALLAGLDAAFWWAGPIFFWPALPLAVAASGAVAGWHLVALMDEMRVEAQRLMLAGGRAGWAARPLAVPLAGLAAAAIALLGLLLVGFSLALNVLAG